MNYRVTLSIAHTNNESFRICKDFVDVDDFDISIVYKAMLGWTRSMLNYVRSNSTMTFLDSDNRVVFIRDTNLITATLRFTKWHEENTVKRFIQMTDNEVRDILHSNGENGISNLYM